MLLGRFAVGFMYVYLFGYSWVMAAFCYTYPSEILPTPIRAIGSSIGFCVYSGITIMLVQVTPIAIEHISWKYFIIFIVCDAIFIAIVFFIYPETSGKTLEEIAALFGDEVALDINHAHHSPDLKDMDAEVDETKAQGGVSTIENVETSSR